MGGTPHYRVQDGAGIDQSVQVSLIESTLAATYAPENIVPSAGRDYLLATCERTGESVAEALKKDEQSRRELMNTASNRLDAAGARRKLEEEKQSIAASGKPRQHVLKHEAGRELDPQSGLYDDLYLDTMDYTEREKRERIVKTTTIYEE